MIYELQNNLESAYMVHNCRMQGAGDPSYYDRVEKLKQSMCGGIGRRLDNKMCYASVWGMTRIISEVRMPQ